MTHLPLLLLLMAPPEQEIRALLDQQQAAWNRGDVDAFMTVYDNSPEITFQGKTLERGYARVLDNYRKRYPSRAAMGELTFSEIEVRLVGKDAALVLGRYRLKRTAEGGGAATGRFTLVWERKAGGWKILHDHTSAE